MDATIRCNVYSRFFSCVIGLLVIGTGCGLTMASCQAADQHYEGFAYADGSEHLVYREEHWVYDDHGVSTRLVLYRCPAGAPFARKRVVDTPGSFAPDFDLIDHRDGYREGVRSSGGLREIYLQKNAQASVKTVPLPIQKDGVIDADFDAYVRNRWTELSEKQDVSVSFLVPGRFEYLNLRLGGASDGVEDGQPVRHLRMRLDAWFGAIAPTIDLTYLKSDHRLLRFRGISNIRDAAGKSQVVRIEFPASGQFSIPARQDIDAAALAPLVDSCPG